MGYIPRVTGKYKKDYSRCVKRGWDTNCLDDVVGKLCHGEKLEDKYYDHRLSGNWADCRECHVESDWVLIYRIEDGMLILLRTGSHSDVF